MHQINLFFSTIIFRPYVFAFLAIYLVAATLKVGGKKALFFTLSAWAIAYAAEFSSIRNGIPFGMYHYIPSTVNCELWICGVPFMDSLSFTFLAYSSWATARVILSNPPLSPQGVIHNPLYPPYLKGEDNKVDRFSIGTVFLGALLFMLIDVVIDPLSLRGDRWFLGKIYYYPDGGAYFGVTISNFIGWFIVGFVTLMVWGVIDRWMEEPRGLSNPPVSPLSLRGDGNGKEGRHMGTAPTKEYMPWVDLMGPALYYIVLIFNLVMTFYIGEVVIGLVGVLIFLPVTVMVVRKIKK